MRIHSVLLPLVLAAAACAAEPGQPPPILAVWLLDTQPCNGGGGNAMSRYPQEETFKKQGAVTLSSPGVTFKVPFVPEVKEVVIKLFLNDKTRGVVDHYLLLANQDLEAPFGAIVVTELPPTHTSYEAAFQAVEHLQRSSAREAFADIRQREIQDPKLGKGREYITPNRVGSHCFPTADYQFQPGDSKLGTVGISRFFLSGNKLIEAAFIVVVPRTLSKAEWDKYAQKEMDRYVGGLTLSGSNALQPPPAAPAKPTVEARPTPPAEPAAEPRAVRSRPSVDIEIRNDSTNHLNWVTVLWDEGEQTAGVLSPGASKVSIDAGLPKAPKSDTAYMEFVDDNDGWDYKAQRPNAERKRFRIPVDVSALKKLAPGHYNVKFSILSFTEAKLQIEKQDR